MQRRFLWSAAVFAAIPFLVFACGGGRSDIDLLLDSPDGGAGAAGKGGVGGKGGAAGSAGASLAGSAGSAVSGSGGTASGTAGAGGASGVGGTAGAGGSTAGSGGTGVAGTSSGVCIPGQQFECACIGTTSKGVQACLPGGNGFGPCTGCPSGVGGSGGAGGSGGTGGTAGSGGTGGAPGGNGGKGGSSQGGAGEGPDGGDIFDALPFPLPDSGPVGQCIGCLQSNCGDQINACYNNPNCAQGIQCAVTDCLGGNLVGGMGMGGGPDFQCLLQCFGGDFTAAFDAVQAFQCVTQTCGTDCGGGILGDGGGFPLGGLGGGMTPTPNMPGAQYIDGVRVPRPEEVPGYPWLQQALTPKR